MQNNASSIKSMDNYTSILIKQKTRQYLKDFGKKGQTYDDIIMELVKREKIRNDLPDQPTQQLESSKSYQ